MAGLISAELYKLVNGIADIEKYRNTFLNLAIPAFSFSEPMAPAKVSFVLTVIYYLTFCREDNVPERQNVDLVGSF